ncbi:MAG TPA: molybdopterin-guanine dinucleotide biosynthesis protein B [Longimicrobiales bacterium]|nr:molybdopterin-guanine dinucleotide biosynthesis protein B [Longimicrobiales bacterium]
MTRPALLGAVLVGGKGTRFGGPKAAATVRGVPMAERVARAVSEVAARTVLVGDGPVAGAVRPRLEDPVPGAGPLGGLEAALVEAERLGLDGVLLVACDLPLIEPELLSRLVESLGEAPAVAPEREGGVEAACAVYARRTLTDVRAAMASEDRSLHALFRTVRGRVVPRAELGPTAEVAFLNVNTAADRAHAERALAAREGGPGGTTPPLVCVVGKKRSGKTTTVVGLIRALRARGRRVMSVKHGHGFELDHEGTDSWRHRFEGGAERVLMAGPGQLALVGGWGAGGEEPLEALAARFLADADVVVAEGFKASGARRIEVFRRAAHVRPLYGEDPAHDRVYLAVLTDAPDFRAHVPVLDIDDPNRFERLADLVEAGVLGRSP